MSTLTPVVLSGGSGTRLWPLSTIDRPKQFVPLLGETTLFETTLRRLGALPEIASPIVVTGASYADLTKQGAAAAGMEVITIVEPTGRNTAPAAIAAALSVDPDHILIILPSDHVVRDVSAFEDAIASCVQLAEDDRIVALGVVPTRAETGYGYIELGDSAPPGHFIASFVEKPSVEKASQLLAGGDHLWNAGMFVSRAGHLISETETHTPGLVDDVRASLTERDGDVIVLGESFSSVEPISLDHGVMEKTSTGAVVPLDAGWSDVGSYASLLEVLDTDGDGNSVDGEVTTRDVTNTLVKAMSREVVVAGVDGLAIVETPDRVLIVGLDSSQSVKDLADGN